MTNPSDDKRLKGQKDAVRTREQLIEAATSLFALHGFDGVSVDAIATRAGVNKAMINYHFDNKEGLYQAILQELLETTRDEFNALRVADIPPPEKLASVIAAFARIQQTRPSTAAMLMRELLSGGRFVGTERLPKFLAVFDAVRAVIAEGVEKGAFRPVPPLPTHLTVLGAIVFFFATTPFRERLIQEGRLPVEPPTAEIFTRNLQEMVLRGLAPDDKAASAKGDTR